MEDCIPWDRAVDRDGYGRAKHEGKTWKAHRLAYVLAFGPIPAGLEVRHSCDNPPCVNVDHLSLGTHAENMQDMVDRGRSGRGVPRSLAARPTCKAGHEYTPENTHVQSVKNGTRRVCRTCQAEYARRWRRRNVP